MQISRFSWAVLLLCLGVGQILHAENAADPKKNKNAPKPAPENPNAPANVEGTYYIPTEKNGQAMLQLRSDGVFALTAGDGSLHEGIYRYMKGWLSLDSGFHRRELTVEKDPAGLKVSRLKQDKTKSGDPIGELRPQKGENETWRLKDAPLVAEVKKPEPKPEEKVAEVKPVAPIPPVVEAPKPEPVAKVEAPKVIEPVKVVEAPRHVEPKVIARTEPKVEAPPPPPPVAEPIKKPEPAPVAKIEAPAPQPEPVKEPKVAVAPPVNSSHPEKPAEPVKAEEPKTEKAEQITGRFRFSANALVTETLVLRKDGAFIYKDSNGVAVAGYYQWKGAELQLTAGGMMRLLRASATPTGALILTKSENSTLKGGGELAYMSPCTRASAQYEKIANE